MRRHFKNFSGQMIDAVEQTAAAGDKDSSAGGIDERFFFDGALEQLESFAEAQMNDRIERLSLDFFAGESGIVLEQNCFARQTIPENAAAFFDFYFFGARHWDAQPHRNVVGDVIAADCQDAALFHRAVDIKNVIGRAAADIDYERAKIFLMLRQHDLRGSERAKNDVLDFERKFFHAPNRVLNPVSHAVNDVKIGLDFFAEHSDRIENAILTVGVIMLND